MAWQMRRSIAGASLKQKTSATSTSVFGERTPKRVCVCVSAILGEGVVVRHARQGACSGAVCAPPRALARVRRPSRMHACMHARTHARPHACMHARTHARTHACMHAFTHAFTHACMHARTRTCAHRQCSLSCRCALASPVRPCWRGTLHTVTVLSLPLLRTATVPKKKKRRPVADHSLYPVLGGGGCAAF